jgi:dolichyl-diphosphooligosaccharide--protein glycosyltransferase/undecaprenyl-diphosphooligosaccharide--protein glycosyltransferase
MTLFDYKEEQWSDAKSILLLIIIAYLFSFALRLIWVYQMGGHPEALWNGELMINTNDGYYFATAAKSILEGTNAYNPQIPGAVKTYPVMVYLTVYAVKLLPVSIETVILYMPAVISSLIVIPVILLGRLLGLPLLGFFAALIASIGWSYYNRTMVGYYDSDMFAVLMQMFVLYSLVALAARHRFSDAVWAFVFIVLYPYFYPQGLSLIYGMYLIYIFYVLLFLRENDAVYLGIAAVALALMPEALWIKTSAFVILLGVFRAAVVTRKIRMAVSFLVLGIFLFEANLFSLIYGKVAGYLNRGTEEEGLHFFQVIQTVREAGRIPFSVMADRISGSSVGVVLSLIGYILLVWKKREMIIALPLIGVGVFSLWGGLRFTVYAVPVAAISVVFLFYFVVGNLKDKRARYALIVLMTAAMLYPNIRHIIEYRVQTVFNKLEVAALDKVAKTGSEKDYMIAWWDYGYPIWYYADKNTLIDGSKHHHDNFIVSEILTTDSQLEAARLSRIAVETYVENGYRTVADTLWENNGSPEKNPNRFLEKLRNEKSMELPPKKREVYLYLPLRMSGIFPTVSLFSSIDLVSGERRDPGKFFKFYIRGQRENLVFLTGGVVFDIETATLRSERGNVPLHRFVVVRRDDKGGVSVEETLRSPESSWSLIYLPRYRFFLLLDEKMYNSLYVQLFFLERYDPSLFEPVVRTPLSKIYRVKI